MGENKEFEGRVLVFMPTGRDASLVCSTLESAGIHSQGCNDLAVLKENIEEGVGAILIAEEVFKNGTPERLHESFAEQPLWSDIPVVLFAANGQTAERLLENVGTRFNATIVERPIRIAMLVSAVRGALRARLRQYETRDLLRELELADKQKDLFLATLSHELRTPLNSIIGWISLLRKEQSDAVNLSHGLDVIERNAKAQAELIADILFTSRVITGKVELYRAESDIVSIVRNAIEDVRPSFQAQGIRLGLSSASGGAAVFGDADRLRQVFWNLLSNAVKFTPPGGRIEVSIEHDEKSVIVRIADTGRGIKPEFLPYVFDRFRQGDATYTRRAGGLGLGLAIVRHLVELHGGTVRAESAGQNAGSVFTVSLPLKTREDGTGIDRRGGATRSLEPDTSLLGVRALLIEDDNDSREMLAVLLGHYGMEVMTVESAAAAIGIVQQKKPQIIISDVGLPGEDGYELIRKIRLLPPSEGGSIPAVAVTGYVSLQDRELAIRAGYQDHIAKPVDIDELVSTVKKLLSARVEAAPADGRKAN